ncbi:MAG TPA: CopD family protein [Gemmatimonadaceae bacterium]|nr:CopD family protein [Gemmatimonadaceae bacterium]
MNDSALRTPIRRWLLRAVAALLLLAACPAPALAHAHLQRATPAAGARLTIAPRELVLTFSEAPTLGMSALRLVGPDSAAVALATLGHSGGARTLSATITGPLAAGTYTVLWQTAGDDGHVQHGSYTFVIAEGAEGLAPPPATAAPLATKSTHADSAAASRATTRDSVAAPLHPNAFDVSSPAYVAIRWLQFASLLVLLGAVAFRWWVLPRVGVTIAEPARRDLSYGAAGAGLWGAWFLAVSALARLAAQLGTMYSSAAVGGVSWSAMLLGTPWGHGWLLEIVAIAFVVAGLRAVRREATLVLPWRIAAAATMALAFVPALSGHAIADRTFAPFTVLFDAAHVLAAGTWLGTLLVMLVVGMPVALRAASGGRAESLATMVNAFSPLALGSAAVLVFSGVVAARVHVGSWAAFTDTTYGRTLLIKLAIVVLLVLVGAFNWRRVRPSLISPDTGAPERLRRSATFELVLAALVLAVTAVLVALPTPIDLAR